MRIADNEDVWCKLGKTYVRQFTAIGRNNDDEMIKMISSDFSHVKFSKITKEFSCLKLEIFLPDMITFSLSYRASNLSELNFVIISAVLNI